MKNIDHRIKQLEAEIKELREYKRGWTKEEKALVIAGVHYGLSIKTISGLISRKRYEQVKSLVRSLRESGEIKAPARMRKNWTEAEDLDLRARALACESVETISEALKLRTSQVEARLRTVLDESEWAVYRECAR